MACNTGISGCKGDSEGGANAGTDSSGGKDASKSTAICLPQHWKEARRRPPALCVPVGVGGLREKEEVRQETCQPPEEHLSKHAISACDWPALKQPWKKETRQQPAEGVPAGIAAEWPALTKPGKKQKHLSAMSKPVAETPAQAYERDLCSALEMPNATGTIKRLSAGGEVERLRSSLEEERQRRRLLQEHLLKYQMALAEKSWDLAALKAKNVQVKDDLDAALGRMRDINANVRHENGNLRAHLDLATASAAVAEAKAKEEAQANYVERMRSYVLHGILSTNWDTFVRVLSCRNCNKVERGALICQCCWSPLRLCDQCAFWKLYTYLNEETVSSAGFKDAVAGLPQSSARIADIDMSNSAEASTIAAFLKAEDELKGGTVFGKQIRPSDDVLSQRCPCGAIRVSLYRILLLSASDIATLYDQEIMMPSRKQPLA